jgi:pimeloyl-ACP methyl ester carboxylesterase
MSVIAQLPITDYVLVGHSMTAQMLASHRPQGLKGIFLISPAPAGPLLLSDEVREAQLSAFNNREVGEAVIRGTLSSRLSDEDVEMFLEGSKTGSKWAKARWPKYAISFKVL